MKLFDKNEHGVSQLINSNYPKFLELWKQGVANNWSPLEVNMNDDISQWKTNVITPDEKLLIKRVLGLFAAGESLVANSINLAEWKYITDGAARQYLMRKNYEESLHNMTVAVCCSAYQLEVSEVAEAYENIQTIKNKDKFLMDSLRCFNKNFDIEKHLDQFLINMVIFYCICEGIWFFTNFAMILAMGRRNKLTGLCDQILYTLRDETLHVEFGVEVLNLSQQQYPEIWDEKFKSDIIYIVKNAVELEIEYAKEMLPRGILGVNVESLTKYIKYLADLRMTSIGLSKIYGENNPYSWLGEAQDAQGMSAFFERREKNYRNRGDLEDDF